MRLSRTLSRYVLREVLGYSVLGFLVFAGILIIQNLLRRLDELAAVGFVASDALAVLACLFAMLAAYAVPVAFLFGVLVAMGRLSTDSEVVAMRACGVGLRGLLAPVLALAVLISALTAVLIIEVEPAARLRLRGVLKEMASRGALIEPGRFRRLDDSRVFFVRERDRENRLAGVFIDDRSQPERPFLVFAERGRFGFDAERSLIQLDLENGELHLDVDASDAARTRRIVFASFAYRMDASALLDAMRERKPSQLSLSELRHALAALERGELPESYKERDPRAYQVQIHRRLALPLAPLLFALVGVPLGVRGGRGARSWGTLLCVLLVFAYYVLLSLGQFLAEEGLAPPALALWLPNLAFAAAAVPLLRRARRGGL